MGDIAISVWNVLRNSQVIVELCITVGGTWFVMVSETNEEVILNCLAVTFMSEIDEMMHRCFSGDVAKSLLKNQPEQSMSGHPVLDCFGHCLPFLKLLVLGLGILTAMCLVKACPGS